MRVGYLLLWAAIGILSSCEAASTAASSPVSSATTHTRFLRSAKTTDLDSLEDDDEERGGTIAGGLIRDSATTKKWLQALLDQGKSLDDVKGILGLKGLNLESMLAHRNWNAFDRYQRMRYEKDTLGAMPYANFGTGLQTKKNTQEVLQGWIIYDRSVEDVGKFLKVWGLPRSEQLLNENWRAFKAYQKMYAQYYDATKYAYFDNSYRGIDEVKETLSKWAMSGYPVDDIAKTLGLKGLSGTQLTDHMNYRALKTYSSYFKKMQPFRDAEAKRKALAEAQRKALAKARAAAARNA